MADNPVFFAKTDNPEMARAFSQAQQTFPYFWRELSWEYRRIIPGLGVACVKVAFSQEREGTEPEVEHMWINEVSFDGDMISGVLVNDPHYITNIANGDPVEIPLSRISDWLFSINNIAYGGFTIQAMRSGMTEKERREHDKAWGLDFGDYHDVLLVHEQKQKPENLLDHPMDKNMKEKLEEFLSQHPNEISAADEAGYTLLHREAIAGNRGSVEVLKRSGADLSAKTHSGKTAYDFALQLGWKHLLPLLDSLMQKT